MLKYNLENNVLLIHHFTCSISVQVILHHSIIFIAHKRHFYSLKSVLGFLFHILQMCVTDAKIIFRVITNIGNHLVIQNIGIVNNDKNQYFFSHLCTKSLHFQSYYKYWKLSSCLEYWYCKHSKNQYFFSHLNLS